MKVKISITEDQAELLLSLLKASNETADVNWNVQMDLLIAATERALDK